MLKGLEIIEEKFIDEKQNVFLIEYKYNHNSYHYLNLVEDEIKIKYIPSSKIYFDVENNLEPIIFSQTSPLYEGLKNYIIQYKNCDKKEDISLYPALFIFLVDQSGSMEGEPIKVAAKALLLFLQSLPVGSYYQIIGFGSNYELYDEVPKKYEPDNINNSCKLVKKLQANLGGTDIFSPLKYVYSSFHKESNHLPKNIFILTNGCVVNKEETLNLIENNSERYKVYSIGIGDNFDEDLIKNAGIIGKGHYNFCQDIKKLNEIIASEVSRASRPNISNFSIKSNLDPINLCLNYGKIDNNELFIKKNEAIYFYYMIQSNIINKDNNNDGNNII